MTESALRLCIAQLLLSQEIIDASADPADGLIGARLSHVIESLATQYRVTDSRFVLDRGRDPTAKLPIH